MVIKHVDKKWGSESWLVNEPLYCCKILTVIPGWQCSLHYHKNKTESFVVRDYGTLFVEIGDEDDSQITKLNIHSEPFTIMPGEKHRFWSGPDGVQFLEVSTHHEESDSYREVESMKR